jgi:hypothetical protein
MDKIKVGRRGRVMMRVMEGVGGAARGRVMMSTTTTIMMMMMEGEGGAARRYIAAVYVGVGGWT